MHIFKQILTSRAFFLNCVISLVVTLWFPLAKISAEMNGEVIQERTVPLYEIYWSILNPKNGFLNAIALNGKFVAAHWLIVVGVSLLVYFLVLRFRAPAEDSSNTGASE